MDANFSYAIKLMNKYRQERMISLGIEWILFVLRMVR